MSLKEFEPGGPPPKLEAWSYCFIASFLLLLVTVFLPHEMRTVPAVATAACGVVGLGLLFRRGLY
ncbi:MAG TPA: hypothetical protein VE967_17180 [Gemmatimonadaceae bacterium]|nr:hypothetical protein [Gemmatimonadaceae bacterium]